MNFIKKINKFLLGNYPLIWNTRLVWMLGVGIFTHALFFLIGYFKVNNQINIEARSRFSQFYFDGSTVFFNVLLSIIILLIWIVYYVQNNAFKDLYAIKRGAIFAQFCIVLSIIFINITQFYSFEQGLKFKIRNLYSWEEIDADIKAFNTAGVFLIQNKAAYSIDKKKYPAPFPLEHSRFSKNKKKYEGPYFEYYGNHFQFYKIEYITSKKDEEAGDNLEYNYKRIVYDVAAYKEDLNNCLLNYSNTLFDYGQDSIAYKNRLKYYEELFKRANEKELKKELQLFLNLAKKYDIKHNLNIPLWYGLLDENNYYNVKKEFQFDSSTWISKVFKEEKSRKNFIITQFILKNESIDDDAYNNFTKEIQTKEIREIETLIYANGKLQYEKIHSDYHKVELPVIPYCNFGKLDVFFKNVYKAYTLDFDKELYYFYVIIALILSLLLFLFKITDIKILLLSFVTGAVIMVITGLFIRYLPNGIKNLTNIREEFFVATIVGITTVITSIIALKFKWKKTITAILFSLAVFTIPIIIALSFLAYENTMPYKIRKTDVVYGFIDKYLLLIIISVWVLSIGLYTIGMRKWKGLPE